MSHSYKKPTASFSGAPAKASKQEGRRSTPDSEALASSDDDAQEHVLTRVVSNPLSARRQSSSWLNDIQPHRKVSLGSGSQTGGSQPPTPSAEHGVGGASRTGSVGAFPWNAGVFTSARDGLPSPNHLEQADPTIGFLLNQKPVRKAVRSLSYSVGQQDDEPTSPNPTGHFTGRPNRGGPTSVRHRPSKPSLLGETPLDSSGLPQLLEDDDDMNSCSNGSEGGLKLPASYWTKQEAEASSNALLKQAAEQNARARHRASTTGSPTPYTRRKTAGPARGWSLTETDSAIEEMDDNVEQLQQHPAYGRRYSEHTAGLGRIPSEETLMDNLKKPHWSTSLSFGEASDSHSRRHSFADVKSHQHSKALTKLANTDEEDAGDLTSPNSHQIEYFDGTGPKMRKINEMIINAAHPDPELEEFTILKNPNPYAVPDVINRPTRRFYMVAFKCSRADVYYLPENTGLELRRGDMVITEGDRGVDLGTVTHVDVTLADAKKYKELATIEHFKWLMMFSRTQMQGKDLLVGPDGLLANSNHPLATALGQTTGGLSLPLQYVAQTDVELKPRLIRRVAGNHEIQVLREKEGSEAKAKRICQAKVAEHGLNMEILDAEYQLDYKKLTFYYYADAYINFNELVTDLFKVYKTRIWMSAINPASFASAAGNNQIPPPSAIGPGAVGPRNARSRPDLSALPPLSALPAPGPPMTGPLPVGLGYGRNAFRYNDEQGAVRGPVSMQEEVRKAHAMGVPLGIVPFTAPGVDALAYRFPGNSAAQPGSNYYPFESQLPPFQTSPYGEVVMSSQWNPAPPPQPFSRYNQYASTSGPYPAPTTANASSPAPGIGDFPSNAFPAASRPSPVATMGGFAPPGFPTASRPSPVSGMNPSSPSSAFYGHNPLGNPASNAPMAAGNAYSNPYASSSQAPVASGSNGPATRNYFPDDDWVKRMSDLNVSLNKSNPGQK